MRLTGHITFELRKQRRMKRKRGWPIAMESQSLPAVTHFLSVRLYMTFSKSGSS